MAVQVQHHQSLELLLLMLAVVAVVDMHQEIFLEDVLVPLAVAAVRAVRVQV
jgi:hypothetical protein